MRDLILENLLRERDSLRESGKTLKREIEERERNLKSSSDQDLIKELQRRGYRRGSLLNDGIARHSW